MVQGAATGSNNQPRGWRFWLPLLIFVAAAFGFGAILLEVQEAAGIDVRLVAIVQAAPSLALLATWLLRRRDLEALLVSGDARPRFVRRLALAVAVSVAYGLVTLGLAIFADALPSRLPYTGGMLVALLVLQFLGALGEELGWRGFLQPSIAARLGPIPAAVIVGVIWASWHLDRLGDPALFAGFALTSIGLSLALGLLGSGAWWRRGLLAAIVHWTVNIALLFFTDPLKMIDGEPTSILPFAVPPLALGLVALGVALALRGRRPRGSSAGDRISGS